MKHTHLPFSPQQPLAEEVRLLLTDAAWERIAAALAEVKSRRGAPPDLDDRSFVEAVLHLARTGEPWRDLPKAFGNWDAVYQRFRRWEQAGRWQALFDRVGADLRQLAAAFFDSTVVRAHQHAAGAKKKRTAAAARRPRRWAAAAAASRPRSTWRRRMSGRRWRWC
jgi:transposase